MASVVRLGVAYPQAAIGGDPETVATCAREVEAHGFAHLALYDHLLGAQVLVLPQRQAGAVARQVASAAQRVPPWFGGTVQQTLERVAALGDGWITLYDRPGDVLARRLARLCARCEKQGRDPDAIGVDAWLSMGGTSPAEWRREVGGWVAHRATHLRLNTGFEALHHRPIRSQEVEAHLGAVRTFHDAVEPLLCA